MGHVVIRKGDHLPHCPTCVLRYVSANVLVLNDTCRGVDTVLVESAQPQMGASELPAAETLRLALSIFGEVPKICTPRTRTSLSEEVSVC